MKHTYSLLLLFFCLTAGWAQSPLIYGIWRAGDGPWGNATTVPVALMDNATGVPLSIDSIPNVNAVVLGSSTFDQSTQEYIFSGPDLNNGNQPQVFKLNVSTGGITNSPSLTETVNEYQYDLQQQKLFGLGGYVVDTSTVPPDYRTRLLAVNPITGLVTELFQLPEITGVVAGGSTYNSDSAHIIFEGVDTLYQHRMYVINALTGAIVQNSLLTNPSNTYFNEWEYDHTLNKLFGLYRDNNTNFMGFVEYDLSANTYSILDTIPGIIGLTPGASIYDQATSTFVFQGVDGNYDSRLITINAQTGQVIYNVLLEGYFIELEVDNSAWGEARYGSVGSVELNRSGMNIFPNPAAGFLSVEAAPGVYRIIDPKGVTMETFIVPQGTKKIDVRHLSSGMYWIVSEDGRQKTSFLKM